jgi:hypothetical protein
MLPASGHVKKRLDNKEETTNRRNKEKEALEKYKSKWISEKYTESKRQYK